MAVTSLEASKKDKYCLVCGDKALGYNFNAVSCESCKAFFRRNAHKVIRGRCEGKCDVTVESRSFCKRCRLAKCFTVGMRKDMILNDEQKKQRKQKIIINKLRRQGQLPPQDTYSASAKDLLPPARTIISKDRDQLYSPSYHHHLQRHRHQHDRHPTENPTEVTIKKEVIEHVQSPGSTSCSSSTSVSGATYPPYSAGNHAGSVTVTTPSPSRGGGGGGGGGMREGPTPYAPYAESQTEVRAAIGGMAVEDQFLIYELMGAMESGQFLAMTSSSMRMLPSSPEEFVNLAEAFTRKVIKMAKHVTFFKKLHKNDQISLLKGSVVDIMMLRSAVNYDPFTESWSLSTKSCLSEGSSNAGGERISAELLKTSSAETKQLFMTYSKFIKSLMFTLHGDLLALKLLIIMSLFSADRLPMVHHDHVQSIQETYARILEDYLCHRFNGESTLFARVISKLTDLRNINEVHSRMLLTMKMDEFEPLLLEIFDLPADAQSPSSGFAPSSTTSSSSTPSPGGATG
ncbi:vitamin D3 receptor B [Aplysia californica]|uniref:Vitamin D3 receptor B n=1 Tax=Aplysia californica TaxID=6500 RepID=A0ABM1AES4_APLCA|nr:vitamin D3 receptor B [Aplysia californica]